MTQSIMEVATGTLLTQSSTYIKLHGTRCTNSSTNIYHFDFPQVRLTNLLRVQMAPKDCSPLYPTPKDILQLR